MKCLVVAILSYRPTWYDKTIANLTICCLFLLLIRLHSEGVFVCALLRFEPDGKADRQTLYRS